jgi:hypothetical protein
VAQATIATVHKIDAKADASSTTGPTTNNLHNLCVVHGEVHSRELRVGSLLPESDCLEMYKELSSQPPLLTSHNIALLTNRTHHSTTSAVNPTILDMVVGIESWIDTIMVVSELGNCRYTGMLANGGYGSRPGGNGLYYMLAQKQANLLLSHVRLIERIPGMTPAAFADAVSSLCTMLCQAVINEAMTLSCAIATKSEAHTLILTRVRAPLSSVSRFFFLCAICSHAHC